jgi:adenylate cyclase
VSRRVVILLLVALAAIGTAALFRAAGWLHKVELATVDTRFKLRGTEKPPADIVIVGVDDKTLGDKPNAFLPLDRRRDARVVKRLKAAGAAVIAYDVEFIGQTTVEADNAVLLAVRGAAPRVVMGTADVGKGGKTVIFGGGQGLRLSRATPGAVLFPNDPDGRIRRMAFAYRGLDTFALAALEKKLGHPVDTPAGREAWIDYPGGRGTFPQLSFADVERGRFDPRAVRGKIVVVGVTAQRGGGLLPTSTSATGLSGPEIEAAAIATAQRGFPLHTAAGWLVTLLSLLVAGAAPLLAIPFGARIGTLAGLGVAVAYLVGAQIAFDHGAIVALVPAGAGALVGVLGTAIAGQPQRSPALNRFVDWASGRRGNQRTRRLRALLLLASAAAISVLGLLGLASNALRRADLSTVNMRFSVRGAQPVPKDVALVAIDEKTYHDLPGLTFPFDRHLHATVLRNLEKAGAKVIAYDVQFTEDSNSPSADKALIEATRAAGPNRVVMASTVPTPDGQTHIFGGPTGRLPYSRAVQAFSSYPFDADGRDRRMLFELNGLRTFDIVAASLYRGRTIRPPAGQEDAWIDYAGPPYHVPEISFVDVLKNHFPASAVRGKIVVVGSTAPVDQDLHPTSTSGSTLMPGPEIHVNGIQTVLDGFPLRNAPWWVAALLVVVLACVTPLASLRIRRTAVALGIGALSVAALLVGSQLAFNAGSMVVFVYALVAGVLSILATGAINGLTVAFEKEQARDAFARFVPETVVDQVLADAGGVRLGGVRSEATVMFSDLRGFTSFSETLEPERVIEALNRYLTEMSEAILNHGGTLVAYMGDGIMAVFGAPLRQDDHADRALEAAREMLDRLQGFNAWLREQQLHEGFKMGIGLNSGPVMSGNVGSERRLEYTALGDTTNTAARLEGMTKGTPHQLYLADTTHQALTRPADDLEPVGEAEVRGRKAKVRLWSLREGPAPPAPEETAAPETVET